MMRHSRSALHGPRLGAVASSRLQSEHGAILILLVILSVALLVVTGLAVDTGLMAASKTQHRQTSELLALRALREYISSDGASPSDKLVDAREKAQSLLGLEVFIGQAFREDPNLLDEIGDPANPGPSGRIVPGVWHFRPSLDPATNACVGATPCPCSSGGEFAGACFEPIDLNNPANYYTDVDGNQKLLREINAIRSELKLRNDSPLKTVFARVSGGDPSFILESSATAAVFPSHAMFLLPLTRYAHMETHIPYERGTWASDSNNFSPSESAYKLLPPKTNSCPADRSNPCARIPGPIPTNSCEFDGGLFPGVYTAAYVYGSGASQLFKPTRTVGTDRATKRARTDYACYNISYNEAGAAKTEPYLIDSFQGAVAGPGNPYVGPQPLSTYLDSINYALNLVYNRNIPGDRIGLLAFDQSTDVDKRRVIPATTDSGEFKRLLRVTDTDINNAVTPGKAFHDSDYDDVADPPAARLIERIEQSMLFVRPDAQANLPAALDQARLMLINETPNPELVENMVVLLSNGVTNCLENGTCGRDQNTFVVPSVNSSLDFINQYYVPDNIRFHMIAAGDMIQPHSLVRKGSSGPMANVCMGEQETKEIGLPYVNWGVDPLPNAMNPSGSPGLIGPAILNTPVTPPSPSAPYFFYPNRLYEAVRATRGSWSPLRVPCNSSDLSITSGATCDQGGLKAALDERCAAAGSPGDLVTNIPNMIDSSGRLFCDVYCRDKKAQAADAVDKIFSRSPFVLVE